MTQPLGIGFPLYADPEYLSLTRDIIENEADYFEVSPEGLWKSGDDGLSRNDFHPIFRQIHDRSGKPFVAHGLDFSLGTPLDAPGERDRVESWLGRIRDDHAEFHFEWMSDHLGWTTSGDLQAVLPLPLPLTPESIETVATRLRLLAEIVPEVAFENWANYFTLGDPTDDSRFFNMICQAAPCRLLLDLHNVHTQCLNTGLDPFDYVDRLNLKSVIQIHLSGGSESDPEWVESKRTFRLDSHDGPIPEEVWKLLDHVLPRCRNLRGIVVERLNGTFTAEEVPALTAEVRRAKEKLG